MKKMFMVVALLLLLSISVYGGPTRTLDMYQLSTGTSMYLNGKYVSEVGFVENGRSYVALRNLGDGLGIDFRWDAASKKISFQDKGRQISLKVNSTKAYVGNKQITLSAAPKVKNGYTYLPLRAVTELLDININHVNLKEQEALGRKVLFELFPEWRNQVAKGKIYMGKTRYSRFIVDADSYDPDTNTFVFHGYENIVDTEDVGHTATLGWYEINFDKKEITDFLFFERLEWPKGIK